MWCNNKVKCPLVTLLSTGMKVTRMLISHMRNERMSRVDHLASDNTPFETPFDS